MPSSPSSLYGWFRRVAVLPALVALGLFFAAGAWTAAASDQDEPALGLWEAAGRVLEHDLDAQIARLSLESARISYEKSMAANLLTNSAYDRRAAEANLRSAELTFSNQQADLVAGAIRSYIGLLSSQLTVSIRQARLEVAELNLESTRRKAEMGTASRLDLLDAQAQVETALLNVRQAEAQLARDREAFASSIGLTAASLPPLQEDLPVPEVAIELESAIEKALALSASVVGARSSLELARLERERALAEGVAPLDERAAELAVNRAELELERALRAVRRSVESAFNEVERARAALEVEEVQLTAATERHALLVQQFEAGLRTRAELINSEISLAEAKTRRLSALAAYYEALLAFKKLTGEILDGDGR